jgi:hypothetical protein
MILGLVHVHVIVQYYLDSFFKLLAYLYFICYGFGRQKQCLCCVRLSGPTLCRNTALIYPEDRGSRFLRNIDTYQHNFYHIMKYFNPNGHF